MAYSKNIYARLFPAASDQEDASFVRRPSQDDPVSVDASPVVSGNDPNAPDASTQSIIDYFTHNDPEARGGQPATVPATGGEVTADPNDPLLSDAARQPAGKGTKAEEEVILSPREKAKQKFEALVAEKRGDRNHGFKSRLWEVLQNSIAGMGAVLQQNPNADWGTIIGGGAGMAGAGGIDRTLNEQRQHDRELAIAQRDYATLAQADKIESDLKDSDTNRHIRTYNALTARQKLDYDKLDTSQKRIMEAWKEVDEFDPNDKDPRIQALVKQAAAAGVILLPKHKGDKFSFQVAPDGRVIAGNTSTGELKVGEGNFAKPPTITASDIPDTVFPHLKSKEQIDAEVESQVGPLPEGRRLRTEVIKTLPQDLFTEGKFDEAKYWQALSYGLTQIQPSQIYENLPSDYQQRKAKAMKGLLESQKPYREAVDTFKTALANNVPSANAKALPLKELLDGFKKVLDIPNPKKRKAALDRYYTEILPNIRVGK